MLEQLCLDHHYIVQHLGGPKHVERRGDGPMRSAAITNGALTIVPAGTQFRWNTRGPIEFAHLYISPALLARSAARFDKAHEISLIDRIGVADPLLMSLFGTMLEEIRAPSMQEPLYLDSLLNVFMLRLVTTQCNLRLRPSKARETLSPIRVKRSPNSSRRICMPRFESGISPRSAAPATFISVERFGTPSASPHKNMR